MARLCALVGLFLPLAAFARPAETKSQEVDEDLTISADTNPYVIDGSLDVSGSGDRKVITLKPGVEVDGGTINLGRCGTLVIQGTKAQPVVMRDVTVTQDLGGDMKAEYGVFDKCTFSKGGWWFNSYSSKWEMQSCLLFKCVFPRLTVVDYGIKLCNCAFVSMRFPELEEASNDKGYDVIKEVRTDWRTIKGCRFVDCEIPPTVFWCSQEGDYVHCNFTPGEAFVSDTKTNIPAWLSETASQSPEDVWAAHPAVRAPVYVDAVGSPFNLANPSEICPIDAISNSPDLVTEIWPDP